MAYIILNKNNFFHNLDIISKRTKSKDKIAIVLKDNAYGHGLLEMAEMSKEYGIKKAVVRSCEDAKRVEDFFEYILVLGEIPNSASKKVRYTINSLDSIENFPKNSLVELKVDSGMHRNGVLSSELREAFLRIKKAGLILEGVFTHHRSADELTSEWFWQNDNFKRVKKEAKALAEEFKVEPLRFHSANSASLFRSESFDEDMARVGIVSYGCLEGSDELKPVLSLYAKKISTRELKKSQRVGYGGRFVAQEDLVVSNYDFGYGDGFLRCLSNKFVAPNGERQVGTISMDNSSFLTDKDEILIFDDARVAAKQADTISYEILTSLKSYIKRWIV
ncbi:MAG: alanine racemase [Sulfurimonas sp.]|uniref:alanine racemase n=1 Tax=Sulfurimonas sp. TaxID=2022749 RepID=UPI0025CCB7DE|nr:alanine racemase [Sulfurimonas sp.]MCK9491304.1 alanine racemase [Sulfurimonas sp.]